MIKVIRTVLYKNIEIETLVFPEKRIYIICTDEKKTLKPHKQSETIRDGYKSNFINNHKPIFALMNVTETNL